MRLIPNGYQCRLTQPLYIQTCYSTLIPRHRDHAIFVSCKWRTFEESCLLCPKLTTILLIFFQLTTRGQCIKGKKLDCFEHNSIFCFKLQCASIVVLLGTAIWWKLKDAVVHWQTPKCNVVLCLCLTFKINILECQGSRSLSVYAGVNVTCRTADSTLNLFGYLVVLLYYHHHVNRSCLSSHFDHVGKLL